MCLGFFVSFVLKKFHLSTKRHYTASLSFSSSHKTFLKVALVFNRFSVKKVSYLFLFNF